MPDQKGIPALDQAIAALGQINIMIPIALAAGSAIANVVRNFRDESPAAAEAIAEFEARAREISATAQSWLNEHPAEPAEDGE